MSEHSADFTSDQSGDQAGNRHVESPRLVPGQGAGGAKKEAPKLGAPGRITLMGPTLDGAQRDDHKRERSWEDMVNAEPRSEQEQKAGTARMLAIAAMIAIGITVGAVGGTMATSGLGKLLAADDGKSATQALEEHINRLESEVAALKADADKAGKATTAARSAGVVPISAGCGCISSKYSQIATVSDRKLPSSSSSVGIWPCGLRARCAASRFSPAARSTLCTGRPRPFSARNIRTTRGLGPIESYSFTRVLPEPC